LRDDGRLGLRVPGLSCGYERATHAPLGTDWQRPHLEGASYFIVVFQQAYGPRPGGEKVKHYTVTESVGLAVGFLIAASHQAGLAMFTDTPSPVAFLTEILRRPTNERPMVVIRVGYPAPDTHVPAIMKKWLDDVLVRVE
jgi:hypothetical protein